MSPPPADAVAFPELTTSSWPSCCELGERRQVRAGEVLFSPADDHYDWIVILSGAVEVLGPNGQLITRHGARRFLGEVSLVTRQRPYLTARVAEVGEVVVVPGRRVPGPGAHRRPRSATPCWRRSSPGGRR